MLDGLARRLVEPGLDAAGRALARRGIGADQVTLAGFACGMACALAVAFDAMLPALLGLFASRCLDGLDGAVARASTKTDRGGYLDIVLDFAFYGAVPLAFALRQPADAIPAAVLLVSFYVNGASFLAFSAIAARRGLETQQRGDKSIYFTAGLAEGTETILVFAAMMLLPDLFAPLAYGFAALCLVTTAGRVALAMKAFG